MTSTHFFHLRDAVNFKKNKVFEQGTKHLQSLFELPFSPISDHPEGLALMPCLGEKEALLVVYDLTDESRFSGKTKVYADVFRLDL